jgi:uncharacterized membrane protein
MEIFVVIGFILIIILFSKQSSMQKEIKDLKNIIHSLLEKNKSTAKPSASESIAPMKDVDVAKTDDATKAVPVGEAHQFSPLKTAEGNQSYAQLIKAAKENQNYAQAIVPELQASKIIDEKPAATSDAVKRKLFFNNENWVGISLFNRLGALLIVIGTIAIAAFEGFHPTLRTSILFALALSVIALGEFMNRKNPTTVSMGVSAAGVALIYVAIAASFFALETFSMYAALIASILATALGIFLATRYKAQVIGCFALIGGYLPIFALDPLNNPMMVGVMVYFILLSLFSLTLALTRKWSVMNIIGFALTVIGASYLGWQASPVIALVYACFAFLLYTALPLIAGYRTKENFGELDVWLIILNTFISSVVIFLIANRLDVQYLHAYLCLAFAMVYAGVALWVKRAFNHKKMLTIFTLTSIAFCVIFVPFYFAMRWFAVAWLAQATILACYGILQSKKIAEYSGLSILGISAVALLTNNIMTEIAATMSGAIPAIVGNDLRIPWQFTFDYIFFTLGALIIWGCFFAKGRHRNGYEQAYKIVTFANLWIFTLYMIIRYIPGRFDYTVIEHLIFTSWAIATFALAYLYCKIKLWTDNATRILANVIHFVGILGLWVTNLAIGIFLDDGDNIRFMINLLVAAIGFAMVIHYHLSEKRNTWTIAYKNINIVNLWLMFLWCFGTLISNFFGVQMVLIAFTFAVAFVITRIPAISDIGTYVLAIAIHSIGLIWLWIFNSGPYSNVWELMVLNGLAQIVALVALNDLINLCTTKGKLSSLKIVILSAYFLLAVTQTMMVQGNVSFNSALISIMYAVAAFAWIIVGFKLKNKPIRKSGLFLSMAAVGKLLIIDTWGLSIEMRIISYISLGLLLMLISFVYQRLSKRMEN